MSFPLYVSLLLSFFLFSSSLFPSFSLSFPRSFSLSFFLFLLLAVFLSHTLFLFLSPALFLFISLCHSHSFSSSISSLSLSIFLSLLFVQELQKRNQARLQAALAVDASRLALVDFSKAPLIPTTPQALVPASMVGTRMVKPLMVAQKVPGIRIQPQRKLPSFCTWVPIQRNILVEDENVLRYIPYIQDEDPDKVGFLNELFTTYDDNLLEDDETIGRACCLRFP